MARAIKITILTLFSVSLLLFVFILILLRYPTDDPEVKSTFAPRPDLEGNLPEIKLHYFETGYSDAPEPFVVEGGSFFNTRKMPFGAILVEHPQGNLLIDAGFGSNIDEELKKAPWMVRNLMGLQVKTSVNQQEKFKDLKRPINGILITHGHWDHVSGAQDFPDVPVYVLPEEIEFLVNNPHPHRNAVFPWHGAALKDRLQAIQLKEEPYENFHQSLDWFGDGSVVLVPLRGHTPGSLGIFLNQSTDRRFLVVGDALWSVDPNGMPEKRSFLAQLYSDHDREKAATIREKLRELVNHSNEIILIPVHDDAALKKLSDQDKAEPSPS